jgi:hypothetical protein
MRRVAVFSSAILFLLACQDSQTEPRSAPTFNVQVSTASQETPDQLAVAQSVPGFGGYFIDSNGRPTVWLTDPAQRPAAAQALAGFLESFGWTEADLQVRQAQYDWIQLNTWYAQSWSAVLGLNGAVSTDIDEGSNRLRFTGLNSGALSAIGGTVASLGIPAGAVILAQRGPVRTVASLRDNVRPPYGGYQVQFFPAPASPLVLVCTIGLNAVKDGVASFLTNSHCSNVQGGITIRTDYYQATRGGLIPDPNNFVAFEVEDPDYVSGGDCPLARRCRYSDASRAQYGLGQSFILGRIARTQLLNQALVSDDTTYLAVHPTHPSRRVIGEQALPVLGQTLSKVGRTTGWTSGKVVETCVDVSVTDSDITQRCQALVGAFVDGGDSGSPTWGLYTDGNVYWAGLLWGSSTDLVTNEVQFIFSPTANVRSEMGNVTVADPIKGKKPKKAK